MLWVVGLPTFPTWPLSPLSRHQLRGLPEGLSSAHPTRDFCSTAVCFISFSFQENLSPCKQPLQDIFCRSWETGGFQQARPRRGL